MRSPDLNVEPWMRTLFGRSFDFQLFRKICYNRYFEFEVAKAVDAKEIRMPVYLSVGEEHISAAISMVFPDFQIFAQHRGHSYYLAFGGSPEQLVDELLHRPTGCARGMGGSASIHSPAIRMFGHSGLMGDQVPIAVGAAYASQHPTLAVVGDASGEEDYVLTAEGFAATKQAPVLFVCEDNDRSILTKVATRRSWATADIARAFGMPAVELGDDPWAIAYYARDLIHRLPGYLNIHTCRVLWHGGTGNDGAPEWDRFALIRAYLVDKYGIEAIDVIEAEEKANTEKLWHSRRQMS